MKMTKQKAKNLVQAQQQCSVYFCVKMNFDSLVFWLIWSDFGDFGEYHENLLKDSPLSLHSVEKIFSSLETKMILKAPNETFLKITR